MFQEKYDGDIANVVQYPIIGSSQNEHCCIELSLYDLNRGLLLLRKPILLDLDSLCGC
jgi:hypothetical protein